MVDLQDGLTRSKQDASATICPSPGRGDPRTSTGIGRATRRAVGTARRDGEAGGPAARSSQWAPPHVPAHRAPSRPGASSSNEGAMEPRMNREHSAAATWIRALGRLAVASTVALAAASPARAQNRTVNLQVVSAGPGATPIAQYRYLVNVDNTGTTAQRVAGRRVHARASPGYPASCRWTSIAGVPGSSPGLHAGRPERLPAAASAARRSLPRLGARRRLQARRRALHRAAGAPPATSPSGCSPTRCPTATIQAAVFEDISPVNGAPDVPAEHGLAGFQGHIADYLGEVTTDVFGNPLCTEYQRDAAGNVVFEPDGAPVVCVHGRGLPEPVLRGGRRRGRRDRPRRRDGVPVVATGRPPARHRLRRRPRGRGQAQDPEPRARTATPSPSRRPTAPAGSRPPRWRATSTGTPGSWRAPPASTPSSWWPASPSPPSSSATCRARR